MQHRATHVDYEEVQAEGNPNFNWKSNLSTLVSVATYAAGVGLFPHYALYFAAASFVPDLTGAFFRRYKYRSLVDVEVTDPDAVRVETPSTTFIGSQYQTYSPPNQTHYGRFFTQLAIVSGAAATTALLVNSDHKVDESAIKSAALAGTLANGVCQIYETAKSCVSNIRRRCN